MLFVVLSFVVCFMTVCDHCVFVSYCSKMLLVLHMIVYCIYVGSYK
jgi:hypothetical protein